MTDAELEPIDRFHNELKSIAAAGIPINLGIGVSDEQLSSALDRIRSALHVRVSLGQSLDDAILQDENLSSRYRASALAWVRLDSPSAVLEAISVSTHVDRGIERRVRLALFQTAMTLVLVCLGLAAYSLWLSPKIDAVYAQLALPPPASVVWLSAVRIWLPVWAIGVTVVVLAAALGWYRCGGNGVAHLARRLPMVRRREELSRHAQFADHLAKWLRHDLPLSDGIRFAAALSLEQTAGETPPRRAGVERGWDHPRTGASESAPLLPPLLSWAVSGDVADEPRWVALQSVSDIYRQLAERQIAPWANSIPMIVAACVCGVAVLLYGLGLFLPVTELLQDISAPGSY